MKLPGASSPSHGVERRARVDFLRGEAAESQQPPMCFHKPGCERHTGVHRGQALTRGAGGLCFACLQTSQSQWKACAWLGICRQRTCGEWLARLREGRLLTCLSTRQGCFGMLLQHGGQTAAATGNPVGEARVAFRARPGFEAGAGLRWLQVGKGQSYSSSPIRSARLSWTPATPLPVIPAAPSKSKGAPAWSGSTGVSLQLGQSPLCFPCMAGQVPGTRCQEQQHVSLGMCRGWGNTSGF